MLRCSQASQNSLTSTWRALVAARIRSNAPYELSRTLISVPNTSNDINFGSQGPGFGILGHPEDLKRDGSGSNRHRASIYCLRMIFSENRCTPFRIMHQRISTNVACIQYRKRNQACSEIGWRGGASGLHSPESQ